jgi:hypothetical protein
MRARSFSSNLIISIVQVKAFPNVVQGGSWLIAFDPTSDFTIFGLLLKPVGEDHEGDVNLGMSGFGGDPHQLFIQGGPCGDRRSC